MVVEVVGGILANSLAIATDAAHLLTDLASFMVSLFSIWLASRPSTQKMSFGWHRAEVSSNNSYSMCSKNLLELDFILFISGFVSR